MEEKTKKKYSDLLLWLTPQEDAFIEILSYLSLQEALTIAYAQKQWLKHPLTSSQQLNAFWQILFQYQWRNMIANNLVVRLAKSFHWSDEIQRKMYDELYRLFYEAHPDGPGVSAVDIKTPPVPLVPLLFVPQLEPSEQPRHELLFMYSTIAYYINKYGGNSIIVQGNVLNVKEFRQHHSTRTWFARLPSSPSQHYRIYLEPELIEQRDQQPNRTIHGAHVVETSGYDKIVLPAETNQDRFAFARFLFRFMMVCHFKITLYGSLKDERSERVEQRETTGHIYPLSDDIQLDSKKTHRYKLVLGNSHEMWWMNIHCH